MIGRVHCRFACSYRCASVLNLAALITVFHSLLAPPPIALSCGTHRESPLRTERSTAFIPGEPLSMFAVLLENTGLFQQDRLPCAARPNPFFTRRCETVRPRCLSGTEIRRVHVSEHQFAAVRVRLFLNSAAISERPLVWVCNLKSCARGVRRQTPPAFRSPRCAATRERARYIRRRDRNREKRKARSELIHRNSARGEHLRVGETIRERISGLLHRCRTSFSDVVSADRNRIPARHFPCGELNHVGEKAQRRFDRENRFVLCLDFFEDVRLN